MFQIKWQDLNVVPLTGIVKENFAPGSELVDNFLPKTLRANRRKSQKAFRQKTSAEKRRNSVITEGPSKICLKRFSENLSIKFEIVGQNFAKIGRTVKRPNKDFCRKSQTEYFESRCRMAESNSGSGS